MGGKNKQKRTIKNIESKNGREKQTEKNNIKSRKQKWEGKTNRKE